MKKKILISFLAVIFLLAGCSTSDKQKETSRGNDNEEESVNNNTDNNEDIIIKPEEDIEKNKVDFYLFYSESCGYCHSEREWIESIKNDYPYVNFKLYEVSKDRELFEKVKTVYGIEDDYVPVTIIGNDYFVGYSDTKNRKYIRYIEELSAKENCGVVDVIINDADVTSCMKINDK